MTSQPACAATCAMPEPIRPAPMTATRPAMLPTPRQPRRLAADPTGADLSARSGPPRSRPTDVRLTACHARRPAARSEPLIAFAMIAAARRSSCAGRSPDGATPRTAPAGRWPLRRPGRLRPARPRSPSVDTADEAERGSARCSPTPASGRPPRHGATAGTACSSSPPSSTAPAASAAGPPSRLGTVRAVPRPTQARRPSGSAGRRTSARAALRRARRRHPAGAGRRRSPGSRGRCGARG